MGVTVKEMNELMAQTAKSFPKMPRAEWDYRVARFERMLKWYQDTDPKRKSK